MIGNPVDMKVDCSKLHKQTERNDYIKTPSSAFEEIGKIIIENKDRFSNANEVIEIVNDKYNQYLYERQINNIKSNKDLLILIRDYFLDEICGNYSDEEIKEAIKSGILE